MSSQQIIPALSPLAIRPRLFFEAARNDGIE